MENQFVNIKRAGKTIVFDRKRLVPGINRKGYYIPEGGVIIKNKNLAGYIQKGGNVKWEIIGKIEDKSYIKSYTEIKNNHLGGNNKELSLKTAVRLLRDYYNDNFI